MANIDLTNVYQAEQERFTRNNIDNVNHPSHYLKTGIETIDIIANQTGGGFNYYLEGNIIKYLSRYRYKNGIEDLKKAQWYLNKLIEVTSHE